MMRFSKAIFIVFMTTAFLSLPPTFVFGQEEGPTERIAKLLDAQTAILEYNIGGLSVDIIKSSGKTTFTLPKSDEPIEIKINFFKDSIESVDTLAPFQNESNVLYRLLIEPILPELAGVTRLGIVSGPGLGDFSFAALVSKKDAKNAFMPSPRFLIDDFAIFYAPSLDAMEKALSAASSSNIGALVIGNARYPASFSRLKIAPIEMKDVAEAIPGSIMLEGDAASESAFKRELSAGALSVVHVTTHSVIKPGSAENSKLIFTGGEAEDGNLTVTEVSGMAIDVSLVTLSADEAGVVWKGGEQGFPVAFLTAGAKSVLAPVWKIDRGVTAMLMGFYYQNLAMYDKAEALRRAQKMVIDFEKERGYRRLAHPGFWAPFVLYGSYR